MVSLTEKHTGRALRGKASFLDVTGIDHVSDIVDGDGGFGLIKSHKDYPLVMTNIAT